MLTIKKDGKIFFNNKEITLKRLCDMYSILIAEKEELEKELARVRGALDYINSKIDIKVKT